MCLGQDSPPVSQDYATLFAHGDLPLDLDSKLPAVNNLSEVSGIVPELITNQSSVISQGEESMHDENKNMSIDSMFFCPHYFLTTL